MNHQLNAAREASCDEESLAALDCPPDEYAQMLLDIAARRSATMGSLALGVSALEITTKRLEHIMNSQTHFHRRSPLLAHLLLVVAALLLLPGAGLALQNARDSAVPPAEGEPMHFSGTVVDVETKRPIAGATVVVHRFQYGSDDSNKPLADDTTLTTDAAGKFAFDVPPEQQDPSKRLYLELDFRHPKYASLIGHGYGLSLIKKDLALGNQPWFSKTELQPGEEISGTLLNFDGTPAADVPMTFSSIGGPYDMRFISEQRVDDRTTTDAKGRFRFNAIKGAGLTFLWAKPDDRAILFHSVRDQRGDIGTFRLEQGISIPGQVLTHDGKPAPNVGMQLESVEKNDVQNEISSRYTSTDAEGKFTFKPVAPGAYELKVSSLIWDETTQTRTIVKLPGAFATQTVVAEYKDYNKFPPVQIKALQSVKLKLQYIDSAGKPRKGHSAYLFGKLNGENYQLNVKPDDAGLIEAFVPKGVTEARVDLSTDPYSSLRWKRGKDAALAPIDLSTSGVEIPLGTLDTDVTDLFIIRYEAPVLIVNAVDESGKPIESARPGVFYPGQRPTTRNFWFRNGVTGDVGFEKQDDGTWRSAQLLPDVNFTLKVTAEGYTPSSEQITLKEKEIRTITAKLEKLK
jgi:protocatechuate 3,4-dioxygenase beta subunit